jgi:serine/threonine protein kinase
MRGKSKQNKMYEFSFSSRLRKFALFQTLWVLSLAVAHQKYHVVDASVVEQLTTVTDGDLIVIEDGAIELSTTPPLFTPSNLDQDDETTKSSKEDIILVVAVDGTLAGISKETGKVLWKQSRPPPEKDEDGRTMKPGKGASINPSLSLLQPLLSTTTTTRSAASSEYAAVPSVDGNVFLTSSSDVTVSTSVKELVQRTPFLDHQGRFYVGSRHATAAAVDEATGEVLSVISATDPALPTTGPSKLLGRNAVWVGRVDYSVSVQDARTGHRDVQFSVAEVMSVADMQGTQMMVEAWNKPVKRDADSDAVDPLPHRLIKSLPPPGEADPLVDTLPSARLVVTPSGNLAMTHSDSGPLQWVADQAFDTPIAFAMDASSGLPLGVDIIPDVPEPSRLNDLEYISREMERQLELAEATEGQTIVGAMASGQLYALPLGRRRTVAGTAALQHAPNHAAIASTAAARHKAVPQITSTKARPHLQHHPEASKKLCQPHAPNFPACLIEHHTDLEHFAKGPGGTLLSEAAPPVGKNEVAILAHNHAYDQDQPDIVYHPEFGYAPPHIFSRMPQQERSSYQKVLRILGSWLPPTIALIFVLSFELGRRKRLQDNKEGTAVEDDVLDLTESAPPPVQSQPQHVIQVSDQVLGFGGQGTVVYKGVLDGREVAVKRMLQAYHASADREIRLLIESDGHPNVVRYFLKEVRGDFVYLALELCDLSLHDLIGMLREQPPMDRIPLSTKSILQQIASGIKHIHSLRIVHRDLKPANILLAISKRGKKVVKKEEDSVLDIFMKGFFLAKISDMGLGKQLVGQSSLGVSLMADSSFRGTKGGTSSVGVGPGSVGWQAPEVMALRWAASDASARSGESTSNGISGETSPMEVSAPNAPTSRSVDIFSLGCIFYSSLVPGFHPFGEWYEREANIMHNRQSIEPLQKMSPDAYDLIRGMLERNPKLRSTANQICEHPFFWAAQKKLTFLCNFSDRLETDATAQTSIQLINALAIERGAAEVVGTSWDQKLDDALINNMQRFRTYDPSSVRDLLRLIRNKHHHFDELPDEFRASQVSNQDALLEYFEARFPRLMMHCFNCCRRLLSEDDPLALKYVIAPFPKLDIKQSHWSAPSSVIVKQESDEGQPEDGTKAMNGQGPSAVAASTDKTAPSGDDDDSVRENLPESSSEAADSSENQISPDVEPSLVKVPVPVQTTDDIIVWEGSSAAETLNCRGWSRSEDDWARRIDPLFRKKDPNLKRATEDAKFRTRLCNHWDVSLGTFCTMRKKHKCIFAHGPIELRVKEGKRNRWGKLLDKNGNNANPCHSGGEDTYGAARSIETVRKEEGKWNTRKKQGTPKGKKTLPANKKQSANS